MLLNYHICCIFFWGGGDYCVLEIVCGSAGVLSGLPVEASTGSPDTTLAEPHPKSNTQQIKNETANVVVHTA